MDPHFHEWLTLAVKWIHVITGVAWIGASFYFNWLDSHLEPPEVKKKGVKGELWMVHSGGFYQVIKMMVTPEKMPKTLHWFKYEAYFTWISGFSLLVIVYYLGGGVFLRDSNVSDISYGAAIALGLGAMFGSWFVYDGLCRSPLVKNTVAFAAVGFVLMTAIAYGLSLYLSSRATYIHVGAIIGTIMAFNVWRVIIPNHDVLVKAMKDKTDPDPVMAEKAKERSVHNNYLTLPVLFIMVSSHFPSTFGYEFNWAMLAGLSLVGAGVRHFFNLRNRGHLNVWILPVAALMMVALALISRPPTPEALPSTANSGKAVDFRTAQAVVTLRCVSCHSAKPMDDVFVTAPNGVKLDTPEEIKILADKIKTRVAAKTMPLGNKTNMTEEERTLLVQWVDQGASIE